MCGTVLSSEPAASSAFKERNWRRKRRRAIIDTMKLNE
jgi:hypothetical protein